MSKANMKPIQKMITNAAATIVKAERTKVKGAKAVRAKNNIKAIKAIVDGASAPVRESFVFTNREPKYNGVKDGIRISHTEYVGDIISSSSANGFYLDNYNLNPANAQLFPWLSGVATNYAECVPNSITITVKSLAGTATPGCVIIASTPDILDSLPANKSTLMQLENSSRANTWETATHVIPKSILTRLPKYLTSTNSGSATDTTREIGQVFVASSGIGTASSVIGELYVSYDFTFRHSQPPIIYSAVCYASAGVTAAQPFGTAQFVMSKGNLSIYNEAPDHLTTGTDMKIKNAGTFIVSIQLVSTGTVAGRPSFSAFDEDGNVLSGTTVWDGYPVVPGNSTIYTFIVQDAPNPWFLHQNTAGTFSGTIVTTVYISPINYKAETIEAIAPLKDLTQRIEKLECKNEENYSENEGEIMQNGVLVTNNTFSGDLTASFMQRVGEAVLKSSKIK